ncbi:MAG TPA: SDR family oxidoreductase [Methanospirillum sp.]|uniref:SDR family oxidoreductase n=1 Tax=Methanospirillum sp. TaxID=45200 RepID=UPI002B8085FD|nr:SDR family oxidoreductase [Methanospirillum sp.]HOJ96941.1 SDR family oxidoreductase [Methanospirillum sp.]
MKYVITGGAGFIGSHIAEELSKKHEVIIVDNLLSGKESNIASLSIQFKQGSITDLSFLMEVFKGVDGIFHQAAITSVAGSVTSPFQTHEVNCTGTLHVLLAARDCGVKKVVCASSASVYGDSPVLPKIETMLPCPLSPYGVTKLTGEHYARVFSELYGLQTVSLRYFNVFGPRQDPQSEYAAVIPKFISRILRHESVLIYGDGSQTRDFVYVKDVVQANIRAMESNAEGIFNIACQKSIGLNALAAMIMDIIGIEVPVLYDPPRHGDIHDSLADIRRAAESFGYTPKYTVRDGLKETIEWFRNQVHN